MDKTEKKSTLTKKFVKVLKDAKSKGLSQKDLQNIFGIKSGNELKKLDSKKGNELKKLDSEKSKTSDNKEKTSEDANRKSKLKLKVVSILKSKYAMYALMYILGIFSAVFSLVTYETVNETLESKCIIGESLYVTEMARPLVQCSMCRNIDSIPVEYAISAEDFNRKYAYTSVPVLIKDATGTWSAMSTFSYQYFKQLYLGTYNALKTVEEDCLFFPYKTEFDRLGDVFNMSDERANFQEGEEPWYIGW